jgi:integrase
MQDKRRAGHAGIVVKHRAGCASRDAGACNCRPRYQASVWSTREKRRIRKHFPTLAAAKAWRQDAQVGLRRGTMKAPSPKTIEQAAKAWLEGAGDGSIRNRSGDRYKPSVLRSYETSLRLRILPDLGAVKLSALSRADIQRLVGRMLATDLNPSTIRNAVMPLRAIYRHALAHGEVVANPTSDVQLPAVRGKRDRIAAPDEAAALIKALPTGDRALWATAMYAGLRRGELLALRWSDIDLATGVIRVERSWDLAEGVVEPKSAAGRRSVPLPGVLRDELLEHRMRQVRVEGLAFGRTPQTPFDPSTVVARAARAWRRAGLASIGLHECRHTFASLMIAAGVNAKALATFMGHSSITITLDRYGHLFPGSEDEAAALLDGYLARATTAARKAAVTA